MTLWFFLIGLATASFALCAWAFRALPREEWQFVAALPTDKRDDGSWSGRNLTYYGVFTANAYLVAAVLALLLLGALGLGRPQILILTGLLLVLCIPAASLLARWVEGKANTLTVGGAAFVGMLAAPWLVLLVLHLMPEATTQPPATALLAVIGIAYAFGEGLGRLACISFGCCYGAPIAGAPSWLRPWLGRCHFVFRGATRKSSYASDLEGVPLIPIQGSTALFYLCSGLAAAALLFAGRPAAAFLLAVFGTQGWRVASEWLRADERGRGRLSAYQWMALATLPYAVLCCLFLPAAPLPALDLARGAGLLWSPGTILVLQGLWFAIFLHTGRSRVTGSTVAFHVHHECI
ncbi:MAG: hypothetical protein A2091_13175 [Desulfuromonadales bacterium GWD2_61_12]|nr:MAG: hypothetical protein A2091_13175 [Desulfuromonadales bacterium GWD2_61_12]